MCLCVVSLTKLNFRIEPRQKGRLESPSGSFVGEQTQRRCRISHQRFLKMPRAFIRALGLIKWRPAHANVELADFSIRAASGSQRACLEVADAANTTAVYDRCIPNRIGHKQQYERQRGHRTSRQRLYGSGCASGSDDHVRSHVKIQDVIRGLHISAALVALSEHLLLGAGPILEQTDWLQAARGGHST